MPTYAGKLPNKMLPLVRDQMEGNGALAVAVVTFGNRCFDNSLAELCAGLEAHGFHTVAAAAFVGRHAFTDAWQTAAPTGTTSRRPGLCLPHRGKGGGFDGDPRPCGGARRPRGPLLCAQGHRRRACPVPEGQAGDRPERCTDCGACVRLCPMGAINPSNVAEVPGTCIKCQRCVRKCTKHAKYFDDPAFLSHVAMLEEHFTRPAQPEFYL